MWRESGNRSGVAWTLLVLGEACRVRGDLEHARARFDESLRTWEAIGGDWGRASALSALGLVEADAGNRAAGVDRLQIALELRRTSGDRCGTAESLEALALVEAESAPAETTARRLLEAVALRAQTETVPPPRVRAALDRLRVSLRRDLGNETWVCLAAAAAQAALTPPA